MLYFDNAATTPLRSTALEAMMPYLTEQYGNPSGVYSFARKARRAVEQAREQVATAIGALPEEIIFTSSCTEANNWALRGVMETGHKKHIITTAIEHHAITYVCDGLKQQGMDLDVTRLPVNSEGFVSPDDVAAAIRPDTILISVMWANNEIGSIQPIEAVAAIAKENGILLHTDAAQVIGHIPVNVQSVPVDMLTMSAHKFGGPKGIGALYLRKGTKLSPFIYGGAQEKNRRAGTENVAGIVGMGEAITVSVNNMESEHKRVSNLRDTLINRIESEITHVTLNGPRGDKRLPGNVNFSFAYIEGESLLLLLDRDSCCASSGSACSSASLEPSHVLMALGATYERAHGSLRFTIGHESTMEDINGLMAILPKYVAKLRVLSPLMDDELL